MKNIPIFGGEQKQKDPYEDLVNRGFQALRDLLPDSTNNLSASDGVVETFVADVLAEKEIPGASALHRLDTAQQNKILENVNVAELFTNLSEKLVNFYRHKLGAGFQKMTERSDNI